MCTILETIFKLVGVRTEPCKASPQDAAHPSTESAPIVTQPATGQQDSGEKDRYQSARMSQNRLQALEGVGYRQCYMERFREVADTGVPPEHWQKEDRDKTQSTIEEMRRIQIRKAEQRQTHSRLAQLVQNMSAEEAAKNELEGKRLQGSAWQIPKAEDPR